MDYARVDLSQIRELYDQGLYCQAYQAGADLGELKQWPGPAARILAGRLAMQLGSPKLGRTLHAVVYRQSPAFPEAVYYNARYRMERFGPYGCLRFMKQHTDWSDSSPELRADWMALEGLAAAQLRDAYRTEKKFDQAQELAPDRLWIQVERAAAWEQLGKLPQALAMIEEVRAQAPQFRPALQHHVHIRHLLGASPTELSTMLREGAERLECGSLYAQLSLFESESRNFEAALAALDRYEALSPVADKDVKNWIARRRAEALYQRGQYQAALEQCQKVIKPEDYDKNFIQALTELAGNPVSVPADTGEQTPPTEPSGQCQIPWEKLPKRTADPYADMARFWGVNVTEPMAMEYPHDGLPSVHDRQRLEQVGMTVRQFQATVPAAEALIEKGVPLIIEIIEGGLALSWLVTGADVGRGILIVSNESHPTGEAYYASLAKRFGAHHLRGMVAVPDAQAHLLDGIELPEVDEYDRLYQFMKRLHEHQFAEAREYVCGLDTLETDQTHGVPVNSAGRKQPGTGSPIVPFLASTKPYPFVRLAALAWARATQHPMLLLEAAEALLVQFPNDSTYTTTKAQALRDLGRELEREALLADYAKVPEPESKLLQSHAQNLLSDPSRWHEADRLLRRAIRIRPGIASAYYLLGTLRWNFQQWDDALELYRFACELSELYEQFLDTYFQSARVFDEEHEQVALGMLQARIDNGPFPNAQAVRSMVRFLLDQNENESALALLDESIERLQSARQPESESTDTAEPKADTETEAQPTAQATPTPTGKELSDLSTLLIYRAELDCSHGEAERAMERLQEASDITPPEIWNRAAARIYRWQGFYRPTLKHMLEVIKPDNCDIDSVELLTGIVSDVEGPLAARMFLGERAARFPDVYPIARAWAERVAMDTDDTPIQATAKLLDLCPNDAWVYRQLALLYSARKRHEEAMAAIKDAEKLEPNHPAQFSVLAQVHKRADQLDEALDALKEMVRLYPDNELALTEFVQMSRGLKEKKAALRFIAQRLHETPHNGEGLITYANLALGLINDPDEHEKFVEELELFLDERPDLWQTWLLTARNLADGLRIEEARSLAREASERFPLLPRVWADLAEIYRQSDRMEDCLNTYRWAESLSPGWPPLAKELADAEQNAGNSEEAVAVLARAVNRNMVDPLARLSYAEALWANDRAEEAIEQAKAAIRHQPVYEPLNPMVFDQAWMTLEGWLERVERPEEVARFARELSQDRSGDPRSLIWLARVLNDPDHAEEGLAALERAIQLDPKNIEAYDLKAERLAQLGRFDEALEAARPTPLAEDLPLTLQGRAAWVEARRGNYAAAIPPMQALVAVDPEYLWGWQQLAEWYNDTGRTESYLEAAGELVRLRPESPFSLAMRGEARLKTGDREGAKEDLREALRIYPAYSAAAAALFDACLADNELKEARSALAVLQEYQLGPEVLVKQLQYAVRTEDEKSACRIFRDICQQPGEFGPAVMQMALGEMASAQLSDRVESIMRETWQAEEPYNPWVVIFWLDTTENTNQPVELRISACESVLKHYPNFIPAYDRLAEIYANEGKFDKALEACRPPEFPDAVPLPLRGRAAWIESARGDDERAITLMQELLSEEPDYAWGWRQLERWYEDAGRSADRLRATDQLVRLEPNDPYALGMRGEARAQAGDYRGAVEDFQRAFEIDPSIEPVGLQLISSQLATDDLAGATRTLSRMREHVDSPYLKLRAVQVAARSGELANARTAFRSLGKDPGFGPWLLTEAIKAMEEAGWIAEADEDLHALIQEDEPNPYTASVWAERLAYYGKPDVAPALILNLVSRSPDAGREAVLNYAFGLRSVGQTARIPTMLQLHANLLRKEDDAWARAGALLSDSGNWGLAAAWLGDWKERTVNAHMLYPLINAYRALGRKAEADDLLEEAIEIGPAEMIPIDFRAWLAIKAALNGDTVAAELQLQLAKSLDETSVGNLLLAMANSLVAVQRAKPTEKRAKFNEVYERLKTVTAEQSQQYIPPGTAKLWQSVADRLAKDTGGFYPYFWAVKQKFFPWLKGD